MSTATVSAPRRPAPRLAALIVSPLGEHRRAWIGSLRQVGVGRVLEALGPSEAVFRGRAATEHGVCIVEAAPQDGSILEAIRELRRQGWLRLLLVSPRGDASTVRLSLAAKIRSLVVAPRGDAARGERSDASPGSGLSADLSEREIQVIQYVANGHTNRQIGEELNLSALTVKSHLSRVGRKLGTGDRAQMVAICMRAGLVT
jgi:DNA-binding CsgD family transcriptional regulator